MARDYLSVLMAFSPAFILFAFLNVVVRNDQGARLSMLAMLAASVFNVVLDYIMIFPLQKGLWGGALATGLAQLLGLGILSLHFVGRHARPVLRFAAPRGVLRRMRRLAAIGLPSLVIEWSQGLAIFAFNHAILGIRGDLGVSSYGIIANLSLIFTAVLIGTAHGIQLISYSVGAGVP